MKTEEYETHEGSLYDYTAGVYCGVLVKESIMKELARLQTRHLEAVKRVLTDGADRGDVFPSMWALHYPNGEQTGVHFIDNSTEATVRIRSALQSNQPIHRPLVFIAGSMEEARKMADARFDEGVTA